MNDEVCFLHRDKHQSPVQVCTIILGVCNQARPKYPKLEGCISLQYLQSSMGDEVDFLPANKHEGFLQGDSIILGLFSETCPKYPKQ